MPQVIDLETARPPSPVGERVVPLATILSSVALVISLGVAWRTMTHDPLGPGLSAYDLSSPKAALLSQLKIIENKDYRAILEGSGQFDARRAAEKARTLEIRKEAEFSGSKILFISYEENGIRKHGIASFEKDAESGTWTNSNVTFSLISAALGGSAEEKRLSSMIKKWQDDGVFE